VKYTIGLLALTVTACSGVQHKAEDPARSSEPVQEKAVQKSLSLDVETYRLDNGLTVLLSHDDRLPVVAVEVRYLVGSANEKPGRSGFAHLFEHLMFQGSANYNDEFFKPLTPIGAAVNGTTSNDRTNYYERVPREYLELALWLESDRMENLLPALTQAKLDNQREVVKNERRQSYEDRPYGIVWLRFFESLFPKGHPYDHTPIGSHADLTAATLNDVQAFFKQYYVPANAVVTIAGDFDRPEAKALVQKYFGRLKAGKRAQKPKAPPVVLAKNAHIVEKDEVKLPRIHYAWHTPALLAPGDAEMDVLASVLAQGKSSRLYKPLVYEQKIAKDVSAYQVSMQLGSFFVVVATAAPGKSLDALKSALDTALADAIRTPPTDVEMTRTINGWKKSFYGRIESVLSRAQLLSNYFHITGTADYLNEDLSRYTSLSPQTVFEASKLYLSKNRIRIDVIPVPPKGSEESKGGQK
jgi:zinc protease